MPVLAAHHLILLDSRDHMLDDNPPLRQSPVAPLFTDRQWMMLARLLRQLHLPPRVMLGQPRIALISGYSPVIWQPPLYPGAMKQRQVMRPPADALRHLPDEAVADDRHLHLARMPFLLARVAILALRLMLRTVDGLLGGINH